MGYALARAALLAYNRFAAETIASVGASTTEVEPVFDPSISHTYAIYGSIALTLLTIATLLQRKQTTEAFRIGAAGERKTAAILERLPAGWCALHDLPTRNGRGNIDHVAVGPAGLFTVETKNYTNGVVIKNGTARSAGRDLRKVVEQAKRQAKLVTDRTGVRATPIVVVHGKGVTVEGWFQKPVIDGVHFCSGHRLKKVLVSGRPSLSPTAVERLASDLDQ